MSSGSREYNSDDDMGYGSGRRRKGRKKSKKIEIDVDENFKGKKIIVYPNGDDLHEGMAYTVTSSFYPTYEAFLDHITETMKLLWPVTKIWTKSGKTVSKFSQMKDGKVYVAGRGSFIKAEYGDRVLPKWSKNVGKIPDVNARREQADKMAARRAGETAAFEQGKRMRRPAEEIERERAVMRRSKSHDLTRRRKRNSHDYE